MAEETPGLLKRIFSFGFGKKKKLDAAPEQATEAIAAPTVDPPPAPTAAPAPEPKPKAAPNPKAEAVEPAPKPASATKPEPEPKTEPEAAKPTSKIVGLFKKFSKSKAPEELLKPEPPAEPKAKPVAKPEPKPEQKVKAAPTPAPKPVPKPAAKAKPVAKPVPVRKKIEKDIDEPVLEAPVEPAPEPVIQPAPAKELATELAPEQPVIEKKQAPALPVPIEPQSASAKSTAPLTERKAKKAPEPGPEAGEPERRIGWLKRLTKGLSRSSTALKENITKVFTDKKLDDDTLQELEDILIQADLGVDTAMKITDALSAQKFGKSVTDEEVRDIMAGEIEKILDPVAKDLDLDLSKPPHVILMIGVNGSGKTTTIGKLSAKLHNAGFSTLLVAGDTFRAAAIEQLKIWGERTRSPVVSRPLGSDAAGLVYDAWNKAKEEQFDVMMIDTAGRLQNRTELMAELEKIVRVLKKQDPDAPHTVLLTLDATTGQNALNQVEIFQQVAGVNGLVMTKLDGTARGGILVAISAKYKLPVYFAGVGEQIEDLEPFEARDFARSIAGLPQEV